MPINQAGILGGHCRSRISLVYRDLVLLKHKARPTTVPVVELNPFNLS